MLTGGSFGGCSWNPASVLSRRAIGVAAVLYSQDCYWIRVGDSKRLQLARTEWS